MKKRVLPFLLAAAMALGLFMASPEASALGPFFFMRAETVTEGALKAGEQFTVDVCGGLLSPGEHEMASFQFTLDYPKDQVMLVGLEPVGAFLYVGTLEQNLLNGTVVYNVNAQKGYALDAGRGTQLMRARFEVLPGAVTGSITVELKNAEITRPQDRFSTLGTVQGTAPIRIDGLPMLSLPELGSVTEETVQPLLRQNPAGTLIAAVYAEDGRQLRCTVMPDVPENAGELQVQLDLTGGARVKAYLLDADSCVPLCPCAQMLLQENRTPSPVE